LKSSAVAYSLTWAIANASVLLANLLWFKEGHLGNVSAIFVTVLLVIYSSIGAAVGAVIWAVLSMLGVEEYSPSETIRPQSTCRGFRKQAFLLMVTFALGFTGLASLNLTRFVTPASSIQLLTLVSASATLTLRVIFWRKRDRSGTPKT
jgi:hypothetical protein